MVTQGERLSCAWSTTAVSPCSTPDLTPSNGLAWSADGRTLYRVDTLRRTVCVRDYTRDGAGRCVHLRLTDGYPDGIALDVEYHLWVAGLDLHTLVVTTATAEQTAEQRTQRPRFGTAVHHGGRRTGCSGPHMVRLSRSPASLNQPPRIGD
ncbi:SMP-30/gluconolactonase/LRE family protein [Streptomyces melanosporofaciens]|uniref:SMP-30/gluconolactonase/LRE family protein n=1 Tax=Streptomyces melanosporofaciens TaxID=67327 RepID=UPI003CC7AA6F